MKQMTLEEARVIFGYKQGDTVIKAGLAEFKKSYKKWLKDPDTSEKIKVTVKRDLEAVEVLMNEG